MWLKVEQHSVVVVSRSWSHLDGRPGSLLPLPLSFHFPWLPCVAIAVGARVSDRYTDTHPSAATTHAQCGGFLGVAGADVELHLSFRLVYVSGLLSEGRRLMQDLDGSVF